MDILVWGGLGNSDYLEKIDVVFLIYICTFGLKENKVYPVFIFGVFYYVF